jgi:hypothetical protein
MSLAHSYRQREPVDRRRLLPIPLRNSFPLAVMALDGAPYLQAAYPDAQCVRHLRVAG